MRNPVFAIAALLLVSACETTTTSGTHPDKDALIARQALLDQCSADLENEETCACEVDAMEAYMSPEEFLRQGEAALNGTVPDDRIIDDSEGVSHLALLEAAGACLETSNETALLSRCVEDGNGDAQCVCEIGGMRDAVTAETYLQFAAAARTDAEEDWLADLPEAAEQELATKMPAISAACSKQIEGR